ncbi:hypothetical protein [Litoreibacter roseus]|nr:hypothetical protein [Litoreibacter roseus]
MPYAGPDCAKIQGEITNMKAVLGGMSNHMEVVLRERVLPEQKKSSN